MRAGTDVKHALLGAGVLSLVTLMNELIWIQLMTERMVDAYLKSDGRLI